MILRLKNVMQSRGITSVTLSELLGVSKATISYWINGKVFPAPEMLEKIAAALDVPLWRLFATEDEVRGNELTALVEFRGALSKATTLAELEAIVDGIRDTVATPSKAE